MSTSFTVHIQGKEHVTCDVMFSLNIFNFNLIRYTYKYIQVTECKRIRTKAGSLCYSSHVCFSKGVAILEIVLVYGKFFFLSVTQTLQKLATIS